jgi:hypothetical protein
VTTQTADQPQHIFKRLPIRMNDEFANKRRKKRTELRSKQGILPGNREHEIKDGCALANANEASLENGRQAPRQGSFREEPTDAVRVNAGLESADLNPLHQKAPIVLSVGSSISREQLREKERRPCEPVNQRKQQIRIEKPVSPDKTTTVR